MSFQYPWIVVAGALLCILAIYIARLRRVDLPQTSRRLLFLAAGCFAIAAGEPRWNWPRAGVVDVLVDVSPSTRTADYRRRAALNARISELLGHANYHLNFFADGIVNPDLQQKTLPDVPCEKTSLPPLDGDAVLLFSDARFAIPDAGPPVYIAADPALEQPTDATVTRLEIRGDDASVSVRNTGPPRALTISGAVDPRPIVAPTGSYLVDRKLRSDAASVTAHLSGNDAWPENDVLTAIPLPPKNAQRWWVGSSDPGAGWTFFTPQSLPADAVGYLAPALIVLDNVSAAQLDETRQQRMQQYVTALGGGLIIRSGDHAFGAGKYVGSTLETLSPLASVPPRPTMRWSLLVDGSGSMSEAVSGGTRWSLAIASMLAVLPHLPPDDLADVGSFAQSLTWWTSGKSVSQARQQTLPPSDVSPHGPTNLEPVLLEIAGRPDEDMPRQLLLISDADVQIDHPDALISMLRKKQIQLHVLAIGDGGGLAILRHISAATGGAVLQKIDPAQWANGAAELLGSAMPSNWERKSVMVRFGGQLAGLPNQTVSGWNRVWLKDGATELAGASDAATHVPLAATWNVGDGHVAAAAFAASGEEMEKLAGLVTQLPRDPRFTVTWQIGAILGVSVDAVSGKTYLNDLPVSLRLIPTSPTGVTHEDVVPQIEPGRYALQLPSPREPRFAEVAVRGRVIDRIVVAGRYAPEFEEIGNDHAAMRTLARRTVGEVISPANHRPIDFNWPRRAVPLSSWFAALGALLMAVAIVLWRLQ
jgi:hypothetical protein